MRIARFEAGGATRYGTVDGDRITEIDGDIFGAFEQTSVTHELATVRRLAPVSPQLILCNIYLPYVLLIVEN